jgi:hypothetical protein
MAGWKPLYMPGPRFVQAFHVRTHELVWEAYRRIPHAELPNLVECAVMQMDKGLDKAGDKVATAFITNGFQLGRCPKGETVLSMVVGGTGKISFLIPPEMKAQLIAVLGRAETRH